MRAALASLTLLLAACAGVPPAPAVDVAAHALKMVGQPYRFGGASPQTGFDCSGLVSFSYLQTGVRVPHNTEQLRQGSTPVPLPDLRRGDLLFFDLEGKKNSHVGIYLGNGAFVHAPATGKSVRTDPLD